MKLLLITVATAKVVVNKPALIACGLDRASRHADDAVIVHIEEDGVLLNTEFRRHIRVCCMSDMQ